MKSKRGQIGELERSVTRRHKSVNNKKAIVSKLATSVRSIQNCDPLRATTSTSSREEVLLRRRDSLFVHGVEW